MILAYRWQPRKPKSFHWLGKTLVCDVGLRPSDDVMIEDLVDSRQPYQRFLAWKKLSDKEHKFSLRTAEKKDIRRVSVILDTTMPDQNKVKAINIFVEPVLAFFYPSAFLLSRRP